MRMNKPINKLIRKRLRQGKSKYPLNWKLLKYMSDHKIYDFNPFSDLKL